jgi:hypothetical protein
MSMVARFTENETGLEVVAETVYAWGEDGPQFVLVTMPDISPGLPGKRFGVPRAEFDLHFSMCPNQNIQARAMGSVQERPTKEQRRLSEAQREVL